MSFKPYICATCMDSYEHDFNLGVEQCFACPKCRIKLGKAGVRQIIERFQKETGIDPFKRFKENVG